jgi:hypothetical protein
MTSSIPARINLFRAIACHVLDARFNQGARDVFAVCTQAFPEDRVTPIVLRAASVPATLTGSGWANSVAATAVPDLVTNLGPAAAGAQVLRRGLVLNFGRAAALAVPTMQVSAQGPFFLEGNPISVQQESLISTTLVPKKLGLILVFSRELADYGIENLQAVISDYLRATAIVELDSILFDATAASSTRPAGLRNGVSSETPTAGGTIQAMQLDLGNVVSKVAGIGQGNIILVADPATAAKLRIYSSGQVPYPLFETSGLPAKTLMAIAANALVSAFSQTARIDISAESTIHMDTSPSPIATTSTGMAAPTRSLWQTDTFAIRVRFDVNWGLRVTDPTTAVDYVTNVTW